MIHKAETLVTTGMIWSMVYELIVTTIGPQIFFRNVTYSEYVYDYDITISYTINNIL